VLRSALRVSLPAPGKEVNAVQRITLVNMRSARLVCLLAVLVGVLAASSPAQAVAPSVTTVVNALNEKPYYIDPAVKIGPAQRRAIVRAASRAPARMRLALLSAVPDGAPNAAAAASAIRTRLKNYHGVVALSFANGKLVASAASNAGARITAARQAAGTKHKVAALLAFADAYAPPPGGQNTGTTPTGTGTTGTGAQGGGGGGGFPWWGWVLIALVVVAAVAGFSVFRSRSAKAHGGGQLVGTARHLATQRVLDLGSRLAESAVAVADRDDPAIAQHHRRASDLVAEVRAELPTYDGPPGFRQANEELDEAEWHLGVALAHLEGTAEPPRPEAGRPARCFFDAEHGLATVEITLELPGVRSVKVGSCAADAVRLTRGEEPQVGLVTVGRRRLPWAAAPTWFGGWGWGIDDLPALRYDNRPIFATSLTLDSLTQPTSGTVRRLGPREADEAADELAHQDALTDEADAIDPTQGYDPLADDEPDEPPEFGQPVERDRE
jgi:hypothetical protein